MEALTNAIAVLVALEARVTELVNPAEAVFDAVKGVVKEAVIVLGNLHGQVQELKALEARFGAIEERVAAIEAHPAVSVPALAPPAAAVIGELPAAAAAPVHTDPLAGAPDVAKVFGFDPPAAETSST